MDSLNANEVVENFGNNNDISVLRDIIVDIMQPDKIILFGSYAYGTPNRDSDVDFLVIKNGVAHTLDTEAALTTELFFRKKALGITLVCDTFLETDESALEISKRGGSYVDALTKGKIIYAR